MKTLSYRKALAFDDVLLRPLYSDIRTRSEVDLDSSLDDRWSLTLPIIASPMDTVTEGVMARALADIGAMGVIHRYLSIKEQSDIVAEVSEYFTNCNCAGTKPVAAAIGITGDYKVRARMLYEHGARVFCIDAAHGHHQSMKNAIEYIREEYGKDVHIMAGNVATPEAYMDLVSWGADSVRVGIGGGSICTTRIKTGHGIPTLQSILECAPVAKTTGVKLIADGGIKSSGDIVKALAAGADFVMVGSLLAGTDKTPGDILEDDTGGKYKSYRGMASYEAQKDFKGPSKHIEGVASVVQYKGTTSQVVERLAAGVRSGLSYSGARNIKELYETSEMFVQSSSSTTESSAHILLRK